MWIMEGQRNVQNVTTTYCAKGKNNLLWKREEQRNVQKIRTT